MKAVSVISNHRLPRLGARLSLEGAAAVSSKSPRWSCMLSPRPLTAMEISRLIRPAPTGQSNNRLLSSTHDPKSTMNPVLLPQGCESLTQEREAKPRVLPSARGPRLATRRSSTSASGW